MNKLLFFIAFLFCLSPAIAQEEINPPIGKYLVKENPKISYNFNRAEIDDQRIVLKLNDEVTQIFEIVGFDNLKGFRITQVFPEMPLEYKDRLSMNAKTEFKNDLLYVLIEGNGNHGEFFLEKIK